MKNFTVVILSSDYVARFALSNLLRLISDQPNRLKIYTSASPEEGLGYLFIADPDLIILDDNFPRYNNKNILDFVKDNSKFAELNSKVIHPVKIKSPELWRSNS